MLNTAVTFPEITARLRQLIRSPKRLAAIESSMLGRWYPRDTGAALRFIRNQLSALSGPFYIYGAGSHTHALLEADNGRLSECITHCFDKNAVALEHRIRLPWPVHGIEALSTLEPHPIILSHHEYEASIASDLLALGLDEEHIVRIYTSDNYGAFVDETPFEQALAACAWPAGGHRVLLVSVRPTQIVPPEAWALLRQNYAVIRVNLTRSPSPSVGPVPTLDARQSFSRLVRAVSVLQPDMIYVYDQFTTGNIAALMLKAAFPDIPVVLEMYDSLRLFFSNPKVMTSHWYWRDDDLETALAAEEEGFDIIDGLVFKEDPDGVTTLNDSGSAKVFDFKPYVPKHQVEHRPATHLTQPPRLVWAGSIIPSTASSELFGDNQILRVLERVLSQNLEIGLYTGHADLESFGYELPDYANLAVNYPNLSFHSALRRRELIQEIGVEYDYGLMIAGDVSPTRRRGVETTFASKFLTYLAAGLPVIVSKDYEYIARLVEKWGLGITIRNEEIVTLSDLILDEDYFRLKENVMCWQDKNSLESHVGEFKTFLQNVAPLTARAT